jgi:hypothetical protein
MWILAGLILVLSLASIYRDQSGMHAPRWTMCKESLVTQMFSGDCTLRFKGEQTPS